MDGMWKVLDDYAVSRGKEDNTFDIDRFLDIKVKLGEQKPVRLLKLIINQMRFLVP